jgi:hypothetical protein
MSATCDRVADLVGDRAKVPTPWLGCHHFRCRHAKNEESPAKNMKSPAKKEVEPAKNNDEPAKNKDQPTMHEVRRNHRTSRR